MANVKDIKRGYCDDVFTKLDGMKNGIMEMRDDLSRAYGPESATFTVFDRHLCELAEQIEWKLQILSHACPYDWKGSAEYGDNIVSVGPIENAPAPEFSGGYLGG